MDIQISLKRLLLTVLLSASVITVPGISQAYERGHHGDRNDHYYSRDHERHNYRYSNHGSSHKYNKHRKHSKHSKYNKHRGHGYGHRKHHDHGYGHNKHHKHNYEYDYSLSRYDVPVRTIASHRKGLFFYLFD